MSGISSNCKSLLGFIFIVVFSSICAGLFLNSCGGGSSATVNSNTTSTPTLSLTKGTAQLLESSSNFAGIVYDGSRLVISYGKNNDLFVRPYDTDWTALASEIQVTSVGNVTDHKHIFLNNEHYLLYSTTGDDDLYLMKLDINLAQTGSTVTVTADSTTTLTNDMLLMTDGTNIYTGQYRPSNLNNNENAGHLIKVYDTNLNYVSPDYTANGLAHTNTASLIKVGDYYYMIAPSTPVTGGTVNTQRDLILVRFNSSWSAVDSSETKLVDSTTLTHTNDGDGIWMSTGAAFDSTTNSLIVAHTFVDASGGSDRGPITLRVFDGTSFSQTYSETLTSSTTANRAHFLLLNDTLYVVYDDNSTGSPAIYGLKYAITRS